MIEINSTRNIVSILDVFSVFWCGFLAWILLLRPLEILLGWCGYHPFEIDLYRYTPLAADVFSRYAASLLINRQQVLAHKFQIQKTVKMLDEVRQTEFKTETLYVHLLIMHPCCTLLPAACRTAAILLCRTP